MVITMSNKLRWSIDQLFRYQHEKLEFNESLNYDEYIKNFSDIIRMDDVSCSGFGQAVSNDTFRFQLHISTTMYLEDCWTLEEVPYPVNVDIEEVFTKDMRLISDDNDYRYIERNTIDLYDVVWENVILEKPISIKREN